MLTADLAQSWQRGGRTGPRYLNTSAQSYLEDASELIRIFAEHEGRTRGELDASLAEYVGLGTDYKILRGLIKLLMDRCEFETSTETDPAEMRRVLFLKARSAHPVLADEAVRAHLFAETARELACAPETVLEGLYADLPERQKLVEFERVTPAELLDLYNLAQAQALLYRCVAMRLLVSPQSPEGYRELFNAIKTYRLIHTVRGNTEAGYEVRLDGPVSMFHRSQKYGVQMAVFLPALLLTNGWRMRAEIAGKPGAGTLFFEMDSEQTQLRSHYLPLTPYQNPVVERFAEKWAEFDSAWTLEPASEIMDLGESAFIPDYVLNHPNGEQAYLEILGFWTPQHLKERLEELERAGVRNFVLAAWEELRGSRDPLTRVPPRTVVFKRNLDPVAVELMLGEMSKE
jgi:hypothetical protein